MNQIDISKIQSLSELAPVFSVSEDELNTFLHSKEKLIQRYWMIKKNKGVRLLCMVKNDSFRHFLKELSLFLSRWYSSHTPKSVHGFVKKRSILTNAQQHTEKKIVINADIKSFFDSIKFSSVKEVFMKVGFQENISDVLTGLVTVDGSLATGFSTSPVISNISCIIMDKVFEKLSESKDLTYTRYADDITFSSDDYILQKKDLEEALSKFDFELNQEKYRIYRRGGPQYVTGLTVVDKIPRLSKRFKRSVRLELYYIKKYGFMNHFSKVLKRSVKLGEWPSKLSRIVFHRYGTIGFISFVNSIEPKLAEKMCPILLRVKDIEGSRGERY